MMIKYLHLMCMLMQPGELILEHYFYKLPIKEKIIIIIIMIM